MSYLITGVAGFIGAALAVSLLEDGHEVIGIDNLNDYYDVNLKKARLARAKEIGKSAFTFHQLNIADKDQILALADSCQDVTQVINLAAQPGVRYSLENPFAYVETNCMGFVVMIELARRLPKLEQFVYASSSSVYGGNKKVPFSVEDSVEKPCSLYAATKRSDELMAHTYAHLYKMPCTGLRFFTVYGPWGRPDMAAYLFTSKILKDEPIPVFNNGDLRRDFTYIDDIVAGVRGVLSHPHTAQDGATPTRVYNIGNSKTEKLMDYINELEKAIGKKANCNMLPMQAGDVYETYADVAATERDFGYKPTTSIQDGIPAFVKWYKDYHS